MILSSLRRNQSGITLIETLVASSILIIGIVAALILAVYSLRVVETSKQELVATNLAREGLEVVRNIRDTNWLDQSNPDWNDGLLGIENPAYFVPRFNPTTGEWILEEIGQVNAVDCESSTTEVECRIVWSDNDVGVDPMYLQLDPLIAYGEGEMLGYSRYIIIDDLAPEEKVEITAKVFYKGFDRSNSDFSSSIELQDELTNWQE